MARDQRLGDGLLLAFDDDSCALHATIELLDTAPEPLRPRAGIHAGDVLILAEDLVGQTVNLAARVAEKAKPDGVLVTAAVLDQATQLSNMQVKADGRKRFRGVDGAVAGSRITRDGSTTAS